MKQNIQVFLPMLLLVACGTNHIDEADYYCKKHYRAESYKVAFAECTQAAEQNNLNGQWLLANLYRYGLGVEKSAEQAFNWYYSAADKGHTAAQRELGRAYLYGIGTEIDTKQALKWLKLAAHHLDAESLYLMGNAYLIGTLGKRDEASAVHWFERAKNLHHIWATNNLSWIYSTSNNQSLRNGSKASKMMEVLVEEYPDSFILLDTLAAAYAEQGDFEKAVIIQQKVIQLLDDKVKDRTGYFSRLASYIDKKPWREVYKAEAHNIETSTSGLQPQEMENY